MKVRNVIFWFLIALFVAPYFFAWVVSGYSLRFPSGLTELITTSVLQAALSAITAVALGMVGAFGLIGRKLSSSARWEALALAPAIVPAIAIVLGFMSIFPTWRGWSAVACAHALSSAGLIAVVLSRIVRGTLGASLELAWVEGASRLTILWRGVLPAVREDLLRLMLSIFAASLASFSIPLLLGGSKAVTVEIAIHHAIRFENAWDVAAALSIFQWVLLLLFVWLLRTPAGDAAAPEKKIESEMRGEIGRMLGSNAGLAVLFAAPIMVVYALLRGSLLGWDQIQNVGLLNRPEILSLAFKGSFVTSTLAGIISATLLFAMAAVFPSPRARFWMSGYVAPSVAITGFATLLIGWGKDPSFALDSLRIAVGAALLFSPVLWRLRWEQRLGFIEGQVQVAQTLGATPTMIVRRVLAPQLRELFFWSGALVSFWVWGDYALGSIAASRSMTLALVAKGLLESYRLEAASILILCGLACGGLSYALFSWGGSRVSR